MSARPRRDDDGRDGERRGGLLFLQAIKDNNQKLADARLEYRRENTRIGEQARQIRMRRGTSLNQVAREMGISGPYLSDLERGHRQWTDELARKFFEALRR